MVVPKVHRPLAALRKLGERSGAKGTAWGAKWGLEITVPDLVFRTDEAKVALIVAQGIQETMRDNIAHGRQPDGTPMPSVAPSTVQRREYRAKQAQRGAFQLEHTRKGLGALISSMRDRKTAERARADRRAIRRRFKPGSAAVKGDGPQGVFMPTNRSTFGLESGMMAASLRVVADTANGVYRIFFADKRGSFADENSGRTAVQRVFQRIPIWNQAAMAQTRVQAALGDAAKFIIPQRLGKALSGVIDLATQLVETAEDVSESTE